MAETYEGIYGVIGPPGTGKTTFLAKQVREIVEKAGSIADGTSPVLVSSMTRTAAAEVAGRDLPIIPGAVGTLHSHAFRVLGAPTIAVGEVLADWNQKHPRWALSGAKTSTKDDLDETPEEIVDPTFPGDIVRNGYDVLRHRMVPPDNYRADSARSIPVGDTSFGEISDFADEWEEWKSSASVFDFTDLISAGRGYDPPFDPSVLIVDEVQDLSALEWDLVNEWRGEDRALIAVGDPWQSLYEWRGAHPELFDDPRITPDRLRVLSRSYRVPRKIVGLALEWMRGQSNILREVKYEPRQDASGATVEGEVEFRPNLTTTNFEKIIPEIEDRLRAGKSSMIAATCSYMVGPIVQALRSKGVPFANPWRTRRGDWNPISTRGTTAVARLLGFLAPAVTGRYWTWDELNRWVSTVESEGVLLRGAKASIAEKAKRKPQEHTTSLEVGGYVKDSSLWALVESIRGKGLTPEVVDAGSGWIVPRLAEKNSRSFDYAIRMIGKHGIAATEKPKVFVGTVHSFKGAEADDVYVLSELPTRALRSTTASEARATARVFYVAMTRAKERLIVCGTSSKVDREIGRIHAKIRDAADAAGIL